MLWLSLKSSRQTYSKDTQKICGLTPKVHCFITFVPEFFTKCELICTDMQLLCNLFTEMLTWWYEHASISYALQGQRVV